LHGGNVVRAEREPWLLIDPKPLARGRGLGGGGLVRHAAPGAGAVRPWRAAPAAPGVDEGRLPRGGVAPALPWGWGGRARRVARAIRAAREGGGGDGERVPPWKDAQRSGGTGEQPEQGQDRRRDQDQEQDLSDRDPADDCERDECQDDDPECEHGLGSFRDFV